MTSHLTARAVARRLRIHRSTLLVWNDCGVGPLPDERGRYPVDVVTAWADEMSAAVPTMVRC
ncbi:hypothetical protein [Microbacterium enclense]|uniref:hypothetical protein n=1 Tax=Microbacterium enclense TaxID=993073 RepID=UPI00071DFDAB|nr:hypothetical protein [Microbacterium enclense]KSU52912.1 hypothetical protein AS029_12960 [Microbacterium enclense]